MKLSIIHVEVHVEVLSMTMLQIGKFAECAGDLSFVQIACAAVFVSLNNSSIVSFCCFTKISRLEPRLKFKVRGREIGRARQTFQSGPCSTKTDKIFHYCRNSFARTNDTFSKQKLQNKVSCRKFSGEMSMKHKF